MSFQTDIAGDFAIVDGGLDITLIQKRSGEDNKVTVKNAKQSPLTGSQIMALGGVGLLSTTKNWSLNAGDVGAGGVIPGDHLDDGTNLWHVKQASLKTIGNRWGILATIIDPING